MVKVCAIIKARYSQGMVESPWRKKSDNYRYGFTACGRAVSVRREPRPVSARPRDRGDGVDADVSGRGPPMLSRTNPVSVAVPHLQNSYIYIYAHLYYIKIRPNIM